MILFTKVEVFIMVLYYKLFLFYLIYFIFMKLFTSETVYIPFWLLVLLILINLLNVHVSIYPKLYHDYEKPIYNMNDLCTFYEGFIPQPMWMSFMTVLSMQIHWWCRNSGSYVPLVVYDIQLNNISLDSKWWNKVALLSYFTFFV